MIVSRATTTTARSARRLAELRLRALDDRWRHVLGVVKRADQVADVVMPEDHDVLLAAAWLHDIGYVSRDATGFHPLDGARFLERHGIDRRIVCLVAHHSAARFEAEERGLAGSLAVYQREEGPVADCLTWADMTTGPQGQRVTFEERVAEVFTRYPHDDPVHRAIARARDELEGAVRRTEERLASARTAQPM